MTSRAQRKSSGDKEEKKKINIDRTSAIRAELQSIVQTKDLNWALLYGLFVEKNSAVL